MTGTALNPKSSDPPQTKRLTLACPFCGHEEETDWDGLYKPRYFNCGSCGEKYIYEPLAETVSTAKPGEVDCCDDPDCHEYESMGHCEQ